MVFIIPSQLYSQKSDTVIDQIIGIVGNKIILQSDLEAQYQQYLAQGHYKDEAAKCDVLDQLLLTKLLIHYANIDSVTVSDAQVEGALAILRHLGIIRAPDAMDLAVLDPLETVEHLGRRNPV